MKNDEPTQKQLRLIGEIEMFTDYEFKGKTKKEASRFIAEHYDEFKKQTNFRRWVV